MRTQWLRVIPLSHRIGTESWRGVYRLLNKSSRIFAATVDSYQNCHSPLSSFLEQLEAGFPLM